MILGDALMMKTSSVPSGLILTTRCRRTRLLSFTATMLLTKMSSARGSSFVARETRGFRGLTLHPCSFIDVPLLAALVAPNPPERARTLLIYWIDSLESSTRFVKKSLQFCRVGEVKWPSAAWRFSSRALRSPARRPGGIWYTPRLFHGGSPWAR